MTAQDMLQRKRKASTSSLKRRASVLNRVDLQMLPLSGFAENLLAAMRQSESRKNLTSMPAKDAKTS